MTHPSADGRSDPFDHDLRELLDHGRRTEAADERRRRHWLRRQAEESGTLAGVLLDLGEREQPVVVGTRSGRRLRGVVRTLGTDFIGLRTPTGDGALVPLRAITSVRPEPGAARTLGDRLVRVDGLFGGVLGELAAGHPHVSIHTVDGAQHVGELQATGQDVVTLSAPASGASTYLPLDAVSDVSLP